MKFVKLGRRLSISLPSTGETTLFDNGQILNSPSFFRQAYAQMASSHGPVCPEDVCTYRSNLPFVARFFSSLAPAELRRLGQVKVKVFEPARADLRRNSAVLLPEFTLINGPLSRSFLHNLDLCLLDYLPVLSAALDLPRPGPGRVAPLKSRIFDEIELLRRQPPAPASPALEAIRARIDLHLRRLEARKIEHFIVKPFHTSLCRVLLEDPRRLALPAHVDLSLAEKQSALFLIASAIFEHQNRVFRRNNVEAFYMDSETERLYRVFDPGMEVIRIGERKEEFEQVCTLGSLLEKPDFAYGVVKFY